MSGSILAIIASTIRFSIPYTLAGLGGTYSERSGVVNIGLEGMMLTGAFTAVAVTNITGNAWIGLLSAIFVGMLIGAIHAVVCVTFKADQIVSGLAIIIFAAAFASDTLNFTVAENMLLILCVNLPAAAGSLAFGALLDRLGAKRTVMLTLLLWLGVIVATLLTTSKATFFGVAALAGIGLGSCQSSSRALLAQFTPANRAGEFFSFLGVAGKVSAIMGPLVFGWVSMQTGSQRLAVLAVGIFFLAGLLVLATVDEKAGLAAARDPGPGHEC